MIVLLTLCLVSATVQPQLSRQSVETKRSERVANNRKQNILSSSTNSHRIFHGGNYEKHSTTRHDIIDSHLPGDGESFAPVESIQGPESPTYTPSADLPAEYVPANVPHHSNLRGGYHGINYPNCWWCWHHRYHYPYYY